VPHQALFVLLERDCRKKAEGRQREMKAGAGDLVMVGACRHPGWGRRDSPLLWLERLEDMARNRS
jgi:hypothetical protein